jgi:hypothetical protein
MLSFVDINTHRDLSRCKKFWLAMLAADRYAHLAMNHVAGSFRKFATLLRSRDHLSDPAKGVAQIGESMKTCRFQSRFRNLGAGLL